MDSQNKTPKIEASLRMLFFEGIKRINNNKTNIVLILDYQKKQILTFLSLWQGNPLQPIDYSLAPPWLYIHREGGSPGLPRQ